MYANSMQKKYGARKTNSHLFETLEQSGLELPDTTADGVLIQPVRLLEGIEPT